MYFSLAIFASLALAAPPIEIATGGTVRVSAMQQNVGSAPSDPMSSGVGYYQPFWEELTSGGFYDGISVALQSGASTSELDLAVFYPGLDGLPDTLAVVCSGITIPTAPADIDVLFSSCTILDAAAFDLTDPGHPVLMLGHLDTVWVAASRHGVETLSGPQFRVLSNSTAEAIPGAGPRFAKFVGALETGWSVFTDAPTVALSSIRGPVISLIRD